MQFRNVIGQQAVKQHLVDMVLQGRISHALLFLGKDGSGALPLALAFAQYISLLPNTQAPKEASLFGEVPEAEVKLPTTPEAVDAWTEKQPAFSKGSNLVHPDIHFSYPVIPKKTGDKPVSTDYSTEWREFISTYPYGNIYDWLQFIGAENKQGNITAAECNDIIRKLSLKSFESDYKVLVLWMPEYLSKEGNKLLKIIEEPPPDTVFILVAENESLILPTILSRCQLVKIPALETADIEKALIEGARCTPEKGKSLAGMSEGSYREALLLLQHADEDFYSLLREWLNASIKNIPAAQLKSIEEIARLGREKQKQFLRYFTHLLESAIRQQVASATGQQSLLPAQSPNEAELVTKLNRQMSLEQKEAVAGELDKAAYYIERNANAKILFHALTLKLFHIVKNNVSISV